MLIKAVPAGIYDANCYIVMDEHTKDAVIMDPGGDEDYLIKEIKKLGANPRYILLTHGHVDHVGGVIKISEEFNIPFYINKKDEDMINKKASVYGSLPNANGYLNSSSVFDIGSSKIKCIETPGHTPGGMCFLIDNYLFTGDTLFQGSVGRSDFPGGNHAVLINSIKSNLIPLGDNIVVYPGHGSESTIEYERKRNPFLIGDFYGY